MAHAEPIPSTSSYAQFKVMELAKQNVKVILSGQGADEELAGYHYFFGYYFKELLYKGNIFKLIDESCHYLNNHHSLFGFKTFLYFILPDKVKKNFHVLKNIALNPDFILKYQDSSPVIAEIYNSDSLNNALLDHFEHKLEHLLKWDDRNSMFFSLEARAPFLDYRLVEKTLSLPPDQLIYKGTTKHLLRESMKGILPEKIRTRQSKIGFSTPEDEWFREDKFRAFILDIFQSQSFKTRGYIDSEKAIRLYQQHCNHKINISKDIWKWLHLELWFRMFID